MDSIKQQIETLTNVRAQLIKDRQYEAASHIFRAISILSTQVHHYKGITKVVHLS